MPGMKGKINKRKVRQSKPKARKPLKAKRTGSWKRVAAVVAFVVAASFIGAAGGFGDSGRKALLAQAEPLGFEIVADERAVIAWP